MKKVFLGVLTVLATSVWAVTVPTIVDQVKLYDSSDALDSCQEFLIGNALVPNPLKVMRGDDRQNNGGYKGPDLAIAQTYISNTFSSFGLEIKSEPFEASGTSGINYIADLICNSSTQVVVLGAHIDSTKSHSGGDYAPGGADNGTGVAGLLEAARVLSQYDFSKTIRFIVFDGEEAGMRGSQAYVDHYASSNGLIVAMVSFDEVGYNPDNVVTLCKKPTASGLAWQNSFKEIYQTYTDFTIDLTKESKYSDHDAFDKVGIPAGLIVEELNGSSYNGVWPKNPYYHTTNDYVITENYDYNQSYQDNLSDGNVKMYNQSPYVDIEYFTKNTKALVAWVATQAQPVPEPAFLGLLPLLLCFLRRKH